MSLEELVRSNGRTASSLGRATAAAIERDSSTFGPRLRSFASKRGRSTPTPRRSRPSGRPPDGRFARSLRSADARQRGVVARERFVHVRTEASLAPVETRTLDADSSSFDTDSSTLGPKRRSFPSKRGRSTPIRRRSTPIRPRSGPTFAHFRWNKATSDANVARSSRRDDDSDDESLASVGGKLTRSVSSTNRIATTKMRLRARSFPSKLLLFRSKSLRSGRRRLRSPRARPGSRRTRLHAGRGRRARLAIGVAPLGVAVVQLVVSYVSVALGRASPVELTELSQRATQPG